MIPIPGKNVLSVSRREDIPAHEHRMNWFINQLHTGTWGNAGCIVFWSKDPKYLLTSNGRARCQSLPCYIQFTITGYGRAIETNIRPTANRLDLFRRLVDAYGLGRVVWRFDPILMLNERISIDETLHRFDVLASRLDGYSERCVFSWLDEYPKLRNMGYRTPTKEERIAIAEGMVHINKGLKNPMRLMTCAEAGDYADVEHSACVDPELVQRFSGIPNLGKDPKQRKLCGCMRSIDVGTYHMCTHGCTYCYAK